MEELLLQLMTQREKEQLPINPSQLEDLIKMKMGVPEYEDLGVLELEELLKRQRGVPFAPAQGFLDPGGPSGPGGMGQPQGGNANPGSGGTRPAGGGALGLMAGFAQGMEFLPPELLLEMARRMAIRRVPSAPSKTNKISQPPPGGPGF